MSTIGTLKNLYDWAKTIDPDGSPSAIAEILSQDNEFIDALPFKEGNLPTGEQCTIRTGLPTPAWRMYNVGTPNSKATSAQVTFQCGQLVARSQVDVDVAKLNGNTNEFRMQESRAFIEAMSQEVAQTAFYGSAASPEEFVGLSNIYSSTTAGNGENILLAGGAGADNSSMWCLGLGEPGIYGVFPKGSVAGLQHDDMGMMEADDSSSNKFLAYVDYYKWNVGLAVKDWRYGVRIPNIDVSDLAGLSGAQELTDSTFLPKLMARALHRIPNKGGVKRVFCCNRTIASLLTVAAMDKTIASLSIEEGLNQFGNSIMQLKFLGVPVLINDAITNSESLVA